MRIDGQAMSGGPIATRGIPAPTSPTVYGALREQRVPTRQARRRVADDD